MARAARLLLCAGVAAAVVSGTRVAEEGACIGADWRSVKPSDASGRATPPIVLGTGDSHSYSSDEPHLVIGRPADTARPTLRVFLHGTASNPAAASCLLDAFSQQGPTIGLSYLWLNQTDAERNALCASAHPVSPNDVAKCVFLAHANAVFGGESEPGLWQHVSSEESIVGRLTALLLHLRAMTPEDGWGSFLNGDDLIIWSKIIILGHSQGAGHASYIAQTFPIKAAGLLSGPQDECVGCPAETRLWLESPWACTTIGALASAAEDTIDVIQANWARMAAAGALAMPAVDVGFGLAPAHSAHDRCSPRKPMVSWLAPRDAATPRTAHRSTALDADSPVAAVSELSGAALRLYSLDAWPSLVATADGCPSSVNLAFGRIASTARTAVRWALLISLLLTAAAGAVYLWALRAFFPAIFDRTNKHKFPLLSSLAVMLLGSMAALF